MGKVDQVSVSNCTVEGRIFEPREYILHQVVVHMKVSPYFVLPFDESTDVATREQLLMYTRYIGESVKEELLFSESLTLLLVENVCSEQCRISSSIKGYNGQN